MKQIFAFVLLLSLILTQSSLWGATSEEYLKQADQAFEKKRFQEALESYGKALTNLEGGSRWKAIYRRAECQVLLFRYAEAIENLNKEKLPEDSIWKIRFLFLKSELASEMALQYSHGMNEDREAGASDITRRTSDEWALDVLGYYQELWRLKGELLRISLTKERDFVDLQDADLEMAPNYFDFFVLRAKEVLDRPIFQTRKLSAKSAEKYCVEAAARNPQFSGPAQALAQAPAQAPAQALILELLEAAYHEPRKWREVAAELWRVERLRRAHSITGDGQEESQGELPEDQESSQSSGDKKSKLSAHSKRVVELFLKWEKEFTQARARAEAGLHAAEIYERAQDWGRAHEICSRVKNRFSNTKAATACGRMIANIEMPQLSLQGNAVRPSGEKGLQVRTRNISKLALRAYPVRPEDLEGFARKENREYAIRRGWDFLRGLTSETIQALLPRSPTHSWVEAIKSSEAFAWSDLRLSLPKGIKPGLYAVIASPDETPKPGASLIAGTVVNITHLVLLGTSGYIGEEASSFPLGPHAKGGEVLRLYSLDAQTGETVEGTAVHLKYDTNGTSRSAQLSTDKTGLTTLKVEPQQTDSVSFSFDPLASFENEWSFWPSSSYLYSGTEPRYKLQIESDRPIYRPGQKASLKVTVLARTPNGYQVYQGQQQAKIQIMDPGYQEFLNRDLVLSSMGSAVVEFEIPSGRMLGQYSVNLRLPDDNRSYGNGTFQVEEYKRPEFEVNLIAPTSVWKFQQPTSVEGDVKYYFGGAVGQANVKYTIFRTSFVPSFCWWWRVPSIKKEEVASGEIKSDDQGHFKIAFTPLPPDDDELKKVPAEFLVEIDARDSGGRTISTSRTYRAGQTAGFFQVRQDRGFFRAGSPVELPVALVDLNGQGLAGEGSFTVHRLSQSAQEENVESGWLTRGAFELQTSFAKSPNGEEVEKGSIQFPRDKGLYLKGLNEGVYRVSLLAKDPWGEKVEAKFAVVVVGDRGSKTLLPLLGPTIAEKTSVRLGERISILVGSSDFRGPQFVEIWGGPMLISRHRLEGGGVQVLSFPAEARHVGGVMVRWFGVSNFRLRGGQVSIDVPREDRKLTLELQNPKVLKPGEKTTWTLAVKDHLGRPIDGEATVRVYDRSLELYSGNVGAWLSGVYHMRYGYSSEATSQLSLSSTQVQIQKGWIAELLKAFQTYFQEKQPPRLRLNSNRVYGFGGGRARGMYTGAPAGALMEMADGEGAGAAQMAAVPASAPAESRALSKAKAEPASREQKKDEDKSNQEASPKARTNFAETALFLPQLKIERGTGRFSFSMPEQLTSWRVHLGALTSDVKVAETSSEVVTRKDLMARVEIPRFFREGDQGTIKISVHNESDRELAGQVSLRISDLKGGQTSLTVMGTAGPRTFQLKPKSHASFAWQVQVPWGIRNVKVRAEARAGLESDIEERELPILPSRYRTIESKLVSLDKNARKVLDLAGMKKQDPTRISESAYLQIDPQLALSILNSIPFLVRYPFECSEQVLNRFVPLAIVNEIYKKYPALAAATKKIPKRHTITPEWDRKDPRRLISLMETPWEGISKGRESVWELQTLLDPEFVNRNKDEALRTLLSYQSGDGGFPWFPGGRSDVFITLYVLDGFVEAFRYGVEIPTESANRAYQFLIREIPRYLKPDEGSLSTLLYAGYVVTSFEQVKKLPSNHKALIESWVKFADKHSNAMTQIGKAYMAEILFNLGRAKEANAYLDRAMDSAREDETSGVYWQPEKMSWLWYHDNLESHAFLLRSLMRRRPTDKSIPGMVKWILFNRKGNEWKSTKASAAAVYSLIDFMKARGALDQDEKFQIAWGTFKTDIKVAPTEWLAEPLRWPFQSAELERVPSAPLPAPEVRKTGPGMAFASVTWIYSTEDLPETGNGSKLLSLERRIFSRVKEGRAFVLKPLKRESVVKVGDQIEVQLVVKAGSQFEYVHLKDPKAAGFEAETLLSGWKWDLLSRYEEPRDSLTNFFMNWIPHGEYVLSYRLKATTAGTYRLSPAILQSMYAPEMTATSGGMVIRVEE